jgi:hypothetical protein
MSSEENEKKIDYKTLFETNVWELADYLDKNYPDTESIRKALPPEFRSALPRRKNKVAAIDTFVRHIKQLKSVRLLGPSSKELESEREAPSWWVERLEESKRRR